MFGTCGPSPTHTAQAPLPQGCRRRSPRAAHCSLKARPQSSSPQKAPGTPRPGLSSGLEYEEPGTVTSAPSPLFQARLCAHQPRTVLPATWCPPEWGGKARCG